ncbi:MAG: hypothetical protein ACTHMM_05410 [Agriterribacter sp.]
MINALKKGGTFGKLSDSPTEGNTAYKGDIYFKERTVVFSGTTILLKNVAKFELYGYKRTNKISGIALILSIVVAVTGLIYAPYGLIFTAVFGLISFVGIKERLRPRLYGLTIELNSGTRHLFLNEDLNGVKALFEKLSYRIEKEEPLAVSFADKSVTIMNSNIISAGGDAIVVDSTLNQNNTNPYE